jgi:pyruvate formate lyase activating enzyme
VNALHLNELELDEPAPPSGLEHDRDPDWGFIYSEDTGSALDGPGLRTVFCLDEPGHQHDPDTWQPQHGRRVHVDALVAEVEQYASFLATVHGGVTLSGGEPLVQHAFCANLMRRFRRLGIHTALDTTGVLGSRLSDAELRAIDLVILNLQSWNGRTHLRLTGRHDAVTDFARRLHTLARPTWIRFVLAPGLTDHPDTITGLARFCGELTNVERVEVIPVHEVSPLERRALGLSSAFERAAAPSDELLQSVRDTFRRLGSICPD